MDFQWLNKGNITTENGKIEIYAPAQSDFFCNNGAVSEEGITPRKRYVMHLFTLPKLKETLFLKLRCLMILRIPMIPHRSWSWKMQTTGQKAALKKLTLVHTPRSV